MKFPSDIPVFGDKTFRGKCPKETAEQVTFVARVRAAHPETWGRLLVHPKNEEMRSGKQFNVLQKDKAMGLSPGASDVIIPGNPAFVCEIKRADHTACSWKKGQQEYLRAARDSGAFACVGLGCEGAWEAFNKWLQSIA